jgi:hypothetical protein
MLAVTCQPPQESDGSNKNKSGARSSNPTKNDGDAARALMVVLSVSRHETKVTSV